MFNREDPESRWSQMASGAICGPDAGRSLGQVPALEMRWDAWRQLHPTIWVLAGDQGFDFPNPSDSDSPYKLENYPYGGYESVDGFWVPGAMPPIDTRRPPKERVIGVPSSELGRV